MTAMKPQKNANGVSANEVEKIGSASIQSSPKNSNDEITWGELDMSSYAVFGSIFVFSVDSLMYPFEVLRTRMQAENIITQRRIVSTARHIVKHEGIRALYRGITPTVLSSFPAQFSYYFIYEFAHYKYESWSKLIRCRLSEAPLNGPPSRIKKPFDASQKLSPGQDFACHALAGCTAELGAAVFFLPADMVSQKLQTQPKFNFFHANHRYSGAIDVVRKVFSAHGIRGFYRGLWPHLGAFVPGGAAYWGTYEASKKGFRKYTDASSFWSTLFAASLAGAASVLVSNPCDVLRTRSQTYEHYSPGRSGMLLPSGVRSTSSGVVQIARRLWRDEGINGFFKGMRPRLVTAVPGSILALTGYEFIKTMSQRPRDDPNATI